MTFVVLGTCVCGVMALLGALLSMGTTNSLPGASMFLVAAALAFGLLANALLRD